jgi:hypothetical protein
VNFSKKLSEIEWVWTGDHFINQKAVAKNAKVSLKPFLHKPPAVCQITPHCLIHCKKTLIPKIVSILSFPHLKLYSPGRDIAALERMNAHLYCTKAILSEDEVSDIILALEHIVTNKDFEGSNMFL